MIMMLPFLTSLLGIWFGIRGHRRLCVAFWLVTLVIYVAWLQFHMTDALPVSL